MSASPQPGNSNSGNTASTSKAPFVAQRKGDAGVAKPTNIFSSDGNFLDRFKKKPADVEEKDEKIKAAARAKALEDRIKNRGKKRPSTSGEGEEAGSKKKKVEPELTAYEKEVAKARGRELKDEGVGIRPTLK